MSVLSGRSLGEKNRFTCSLGCPFGTVDKRKELKSRFFSSMVKSAASVWAVRLPWFHSRTGPYSRCRSSTVSACSGFWPCTGSSSCAWWGHSRWLWRFVVLHCGAAITEERVLCSHRFPQSQISIPHQPRFCSVCFRRSSDSRPDHLGFHQCYHIPIFLFTSVPENVSHPPAAAGFIRKNVPTTGSLLLWMRNVRGVFGIQPKK